MLKLLECKCMLALIAMCSHIWRTSTGTNVQMPEVIVIISIVMIMMPEMEEHSGVITSELSSSLSTACDTGSFHTDFCSTPLCLPKLLITKCSCKISCIHAILIGTQHFQTPCYRWLCWSCAHEGDKPWSFQCLQCTIMRSHTRRRLHLKADINGIGLARTSRS